jgi:hypothetical protein
VIHADCHSANKGLFAGLLVLVGTVVSVIIFYIALDESSSGLAAQWVNMFSQGALLVLMIITVLVAYRQITKLDVNMHPISLLDDLLLFFCLPSFFLYTIFTVVPAMAHKDYYAILVCTLQVTFNFPLSRHKGARDLGSLANFLPNRSVPPKSIPNIESEKTEQLGNRNSVIYTYPFPIREPEKAQ